MCVTRAEAMTALRNIHGRVRLIFGRNKQTENSEVAQLIRKSLVQEQTSNNYSVEIHDGANVSCFHIFLIYSNDII